jgi:hypothetical protein
MCVGLGIIGGHAATIVIDILLSYDFGLRCLSYLQPEKNDFQQLGVSQWLIQEIASLE